MSNNMKLLIASNLMGIRPECTNHSLNKCINLLMSDMSLTLKMIIFDSSRFPHPELLSSTKKTYYIKAHCITTGTIATFYWGRSIPFS